MFSRDCIHVNTNYNVPTNLVDVNEYVIPESNKTFTGKITSHHVRSIFQLLFAHHINSTPWSSRLWVGWPCLTLLGLDLGCSGVLVVHLRVACTAIAGVLQVSSHYEGKGSRQCLT